MARMHTRRKGKSGSKHPQRPSSPEWVIYSAGEIEEIIVKLARDGNSQSRIGIILRDQYGIPGVKQVTGKTILYFIKKNKLDSKFPEDLQNLIKKTINLQKHLSRSKKDIHNKRGLQLIESKILRLSKYYRGTGKIPADWRYEPEKAVLL